jgi:hypothetical protein
VLGAEKGKSGSRSRKASDLLLRVTGAAEHVTARSDERCQYEPINQTVPVGGWADLGSRQDEKEIIMRRNRTPRILIVAVAAALSLLLAVSALAAHPKAGKTYKGFTSGSAYRGFKQPVSFKVSGDGKRLLGFQFSGGDCLGLGGPGDPWTNPYHIYKVGTIKVPSSGTFSVRNVKWKSPPSHGNPPKVTTSSVNGRFTTAKTATGTIRYTPKIGSTTCPGTTVTFTAKTA